MAKSKTPLLSLASVGTIGRVLTTQKRGSATLLRSKPTPAYRYTLPQAYQRWLYEDYAYLWTQQSAATRALYRSAGVRFHLTAFQYWMKYQLTNLPDIVGMWHLDEKAGNTAIDFSKNAINGTIFGCTPCVGVIDGAQYFTLNDYITVTSQLLDFTSGDFSLIAKLKIDSLPEWKCLLFRGFWGIDGYYFIIHLTGSLRLYTNQPPAPQVSTTANGTIVPGTQYSIGLSRSGASVRLYINGLDATSVPAVHVDPVSSARVAKIGCNDPIDSNFLDGILDHLVIYNRALDPTEHLRHSERSYAS